MRGKNKCKILKEIRQKIADENDIPYVTRECSYHGDCSGTCPKCEAELRYLEQELEKRRAMGKAVAVAAIAASLTLNTGCVPGTSAEIGEDPATAGPTQATVEQLQGEVEPYPDIEGMVPAMSTEETEEQPLEGEPTELLGDVDYLPTDEEDSWDVAGGVPVLPEDDPLGTEDLPVETLPVAPENAEPQSDAG